MKYPPLIPAVRITSGLLCLVFSGCTVGPQFEPPVTGVPANWSAGPMDVSTPVNNAPVDEIWWKSFHDPELNSLVTRLASQNLDLQIAAEHILQGRAQRTVVASEGLPQFDAQGSYSHRRVSATGLASLFEPAPGAPLEYNLFRDMISVSWEVDLFGRVRRGVEAANADTQAAIEMRHGIAVIGIADLTQSYVQLRGIQSQEAVLEQSLAAAKQRVNLVRDRFVTGVGTEADVAQADDQVALVAQDLAPLHELQARQLNAISYLLGEQPGSLDQELSGTAPVLTPPTVPMGLPSELMRRRPDIREAEDRLHAATAQTGVAVAEFYPDVNLTGNLGTESLGLGTLFKWVSRQYMIGPTVDLPIFRGGQLIGQLHFRESQQREAALNYRKVVLQAWQDVDNALTAYAEERHRRNEAQRTARDAEISLQDTEQRAGEGVASSVDVIDAQIAVYQAQNLLAQDQTEVATDLVGLFRALGGGWSVVDQPASREASTRNYPRGTVPEFTKTSTLPGPTL
jgi:NodT family efflux transporter outer membrane factor (OMF) lipoprotein